MTTMMTRLGRIDFYNDTRPRTEFREIGRIYLGQAPGEAVKPLEIAGGLGGIGLLIAGLLMKDKSVGTALAVVGGGATAFAVGSVVIRAASGGPTYVPTPGVQPTPGVPAVTAPPPPPPPKPPKLTTAQRITEYGQQYLPVLQSIIKLF
ncbi:MAG: hypothetical protein ACRD1Z_04970 [Vicinamibacteria bacterium]